MKALLVLIPALPLLAAVGIPFLGRRAAGPLASAACAFSLFGVLALLLTGGEGTLANATWGASAGFSLEVGLRFDALSGAMALLVSLVSLAVLIYSIGYMAGEKGQKRFFAGMSFFVGAMLALVLADSLILLFAAWEWVGLASWLLIGHHYRKEEARRAVRKAFLLTRVGDAAFLAGWLLALIGTGNSGVFDFLAQVEGGAFPPEMITLLGLLFFAGAVGKSAQLPLSSWLPPAMAGPTPVSALIHSATMVAAGVYLLLRLWPLFAASAAVLSAILWVGGLTALFAALVATAQRDLKRILAWSTVSQLGEMMLALGLAGPFAAAFHLGAHAAFKSTLFLAAGSLDHGAGTRDLHGLGNLWRTMPWTSGAFALAALALAGIPPFSGFWSEEEILAAAVSVPLAAAALLLTIFLAGVYIGRAATAALASRPGESPQGEESGPSMRWPLVLLALLAAGIGWPMSHLLEKTLPFATPPHLPWGWRLAGIGCAAAGLLFGAWRVRSAGAAPALGRGPLLLEEGLQGVTVLPAAAAIALARIVARMEDLFDGAARTLARTVLLLARSAEGMESGFDAAGRAAGSSALATAKETNLVESWGFGKGGDAFGRLLVRGGTELGQAETGKVYLYNLGFFVWVLVLGILGLILLFF